MPTLEELPREEPVDYIDPKLEALLSGPASDSYTRRQVQLAFEDHFMREPEVKLTKEKQEQILFDWIDSLYSIAFRKIKNYPDFPTHPRLMGKISNITLEDVKYWVENEKLKED